MCQSWCIRCIKSTSINTPYVISRTNPMLDHLLKLSEWNNSNKWSNMAFGKEIGIKAIKIHYIWSPGNLYNAGTDNSHFFVNSVSPNDYALIRVYTVCLTNMFSSSFIFNTNEKHLTYMYLSVKCMSFLCITFMLHSAATSLHISINHLYKCRVFRGFNVCIFNMSSHTLTVLFVYR